MHSSTGRQPCLMGESPHSSRNAKESHFGKLRHGEIESKQLTAIYSIALDFNGTTDVKNPN